MSKSRLSLLRCRSLLLSLSLFQPLDLEATFAIAPIVVSPRSVELASGLTESSRKRANAQSPLEAAHVRQRPPVTGLEVPVAPSRRPHWQDAVADADAAQLAAAAAG